MRGMISFHPVDLEFFDGLIDPLVRGERVNPEDYLVSARRVMIAAWEAERYKRSIELLLEELERAEQERQWRAQFVADIGKKTCLRLVHLFQTLVGLFQAHPQQQVPAPVVVRDDRCHAREATRGR